MFPLSVWRILVTIIMMRVGLSEACSCTQSHKQQQFCSAKFAGRLIVQGSEVVYANSSQNSTVVQGPEVVYGNSSQQSTDEGNYPIARKYHVYIPRVFRISTWYRWDPTALYTPYLDSECGRTFEEKNKYFVTGFFVGGKLWTNKCFWSEKRSELPFRQRSLIRRPSGYNKYCYMNCKVETCFQCQKLEVNPGRCYWDANSEFASCYDRFAICTCKKGCVRSASMSMELRKTLF